MMRRNRILGFIWVLVLCGASALCAKTTATRQNVFRTPDAAALTLIAAVRANDTAAVIAIFGPDGNKIVSSGDPVSDRNRRENFLKVVDERCDLVKINKTRFMLRLGNEKWPFPVPIVKTASGWQFDTAAGVQELINRRIGKNELTVIELCHAYVQAQREYARRDGKGAYAQRFLSTAGKHDGLYWAVSGRQPASPLGPAIAAATDEGYSVSNKHTPFHGYLFHILTAQGRDAPSGARNYMKNGRMSEGFAMVAWPASYGSSGVMTFIVNKNGIVYQKNLGPETRDMAFKMTEYDPDSSWTPVTER